VQRVDIHICAAPVDARTVGHRQLVHHSLGLNSAQTLQTLWQVQGALVALGFPFLLLLIQFSRDDGVTALHSSEVLARETLVRFAMEWSTTGLVAAGVLTAWLASSGAVIAAIVLITLPSAWMLLRSYFTAFELLSDRLRLRRKSSELLREKLLASMRDLWALQRGNALVLAELATLGVERSYFDPVPEDDRWWSLTASATGRIADINLAAIAALLAPLPRAAIRAGLDPTDPTTIPETEAGDDRPIRFLRMCGDRVREGDRIVILLRSSFAFTSEPHVPLDRALMITSIDE